MVCIQKDCEQALRVLEAGMPSFPLFRALIARVQGAEYSAWTPAVHWIAIQPGHCNHFPPCGSQHNFIRRAYFLLLDWTRFKYQFSLARQLLNQRITNAFQNQVIAYWGKEPPFFCNPYI